MKFVIKPGEAKVELRNDNNKIVKVAVLIPGYPIVFLYNEDETSNELKYHSLSYSKKDNCIYYDGLSFEKDTVMEITDDVNVCSFVFLEEFELEPYSN